MACHFIDNVHTRTFTPKEFQVELLDGAKQRNSIVCLDSQSNKSFIILKLIEELSNSIRLKWEVGKKRTVYLSESTSSVQHFAHIIGCLTDLRVGEFASIHHNCDLQFYQVLCVTSDVCQHWINTSQLEWSHVNLLVIDNCHLVITCHPLREIALNLKTEKEPPHILGVTSPLFTNSSQPACVEAQIKHLENDLRCFAESSSEIVSVLRYSSNPKEVLIEYDNPSSNELIEEIKSRIDSLKEFLDDHRYDPSEIYQDEEFLQELKDIPDPKKDPYDIISDFLYVLDTMGPWCADKAALLLLIHIEKLKVKTPYERHYLLLCLVSSHLLTIRVTCEHYFSEYSELDRILKFSSPKVLRLIDTVRQFKPRKPPDNQPVSDPVLNDCGENGEIKEDNRTAPEIGPSEKNEDIKSDDEDIDSSVSLLNGVRITEIYDEDENGCTHAGNHWLNDGTLSIVSSKSVGQAVSVTDKSDTDSTVFKDAQEYLEDNDDWQDCLSELITSWVEPMFNRHLGANGDSNGHVREPDIKEITNDDNSSNTVKTDWGQVPGGPSWSLEEPEDPCPYLTIEDLFPKTNISSRKNKKREKYFQRFENYDPVEGWKNCGSKAHGDDSPGQDPAVTGTVSDRTMMRWKGRGKAWRLAKKDQRKNYSMDDADSLVGIIFVERRFTAKVLFHLLNDLRKADNEFTNIVTQYTVEKIMDPSTDPREAEIEHKKQEQVLKRFRMRECNLLVATSVLEEGIELPRCNLVVRYDPAESYRSHAHSKAAAKQITSHYISLISQSSLPCYLIKYAEFMHIEKVLLSHCWNLEPNDHEEFEADQYNDSLPPFIPSATSNISVTLATAISVVNKYCAKLPSDTFTRLSPKWTVSEVKYEGKDMFSCAIRLPINSPVKQEIMGHPMWNRALARRIAALEVVRVLHSSGELDDSLEPIGKEAFNCLLARDEDYEFGEVTLPIEEEETDPETFWDPTIPRPGTTKSRQYYYKKIANCLNECRPEEGLSCMLYCIDMVLTCPLPEEQNTRGRKLHPPEHSPQALGILTTKPIPQVCPFPIFTRSGEVEVSLRLCKDVIIPNCRQIETMAAFLNFVFTSVLRLQKYLMSFDPNAKENSFFIVPTKKDSDGHSQVDWDFLELIYERRFDVLKFISDEERQKFQFDPSRYSDAVVMPWYRNQDQPQYFYVAEICNHLNAKSTFPGSNYKTFEDYYSRKYSIQIQNLSQPLLDVDHTSARLNFLTPRYVNRKGVALPTSSEETKRAKRENLEQKQILVPELCMVHVVPASLWRQAVCLPCILYRINALLLADQIRALVADQIHLGLVNISPDFSWPALDFGWNLADVLKKSREAAGTDGTDKLDISNDIVENKERLALLDSESAPTDIKASSEEKELSVKDDKNDNEEDEDSDKEDWVGEIGMWSNDMVMENGMDYSSDNTLGDGGGQRWDLGLSQTYYCSEGEDSDDSMSSWEYGGSESSESSYDAQTFKVTYKSDYLAEAEDSGQETLLEQNICQLALTSSSNSNSFHDSNTIWDWSPHSVIPQLQEEISNERIKFEEATQRNADKIHENGMLVMKDQDFVVNRDNNKINNGDKKELLYRVVSYGYPEWLDKPNRCGYSTETVLTDMESAYLDSVIKEGEKDEDLKLSFDEQPVLKDHPGPSPALILQALTMSNANDGINLERLETIGDSFLKYAITTYLYCTHESIHEGKLSHLRSKQVSNLNLYRLGKRKVFGESMIATKFEPHDNWLPPCYLVPRDSEQALLDSDPTALTLPYNLVTQHSIPDKSIADCVEALIGAYLIACGPRGALIFMSWLGIKVLPKWRTEIEGDTNGRPIGSTVIKNGYRVVWGELEAPKSPLLRHVTDPEGELDHLLAGFDALERKLGYSFRDRAYLLQAMTHASYSTNRITDCYQRLEFLGDAVLDYLITRHLYEDERAHSPGALTDLRSALVNNTIFASLAVRHGLHKYFRHLSPALGEVIQRFVTIQEENSHAINEEYFLVDEEAEDVEVPKALGDVFESIAGAIFLDSNMSLDIVWKVYYQMMKREIEQFSNKVPKSPIRELLELEPETAKFGKPEKLADGRRVRVTVEVFGKGTFKGIGRNYRIAKCTAAKCALKHLKKKSQLSGNPSRMRYKS